MYVCCCFFSVFFSSSSFFFFIDVWQPRVPLNGINPRFPLNEIRKYLTRLTDVYRPVHAPFHPSLTKHDCVRLLDSASSDGALAPPSRAALIRLQRFQEAQGALAGTGLAVSLDINQ